MPIYAIAYGSHEDSDIVYFEHYNKYTREELEEVAIQAIVLLMEKLKSGQLENINLRKTEWPMIRSVADLFPVGIKRALEPFGFRVVEPEATICFSGWQDPFYTETKWCNSDDETGKLIKALRKAGFSKKDSSSYAYKERRKKAKTEEK